MRIKTNLASMRSFQTYQKNLGKQSLSMSRLSSGLKIETTKDNPTGMSKSTRIKTQISGYQAAQRNSQDGISMMQAADSGLDSMAESIKRLRTLTVSLQDTQHEEDRQKIQDEIDQILEGIDTIVRDTEINGVTMLSPEKLNLTDDVLASAIGPGAGEFVEIQLRDMGSDKIGSIYDENGNELFNLSDLKSGGKIDITDLDNVDEAIKVIDEAMENVSYYRTELGAIANRFEIRASDISEVLISFNNADANLVGTDIALEMADLAKANILVETGISMMVQTNNMPKEIMEVLNSMRLY